MLLLLLAAADSTFTTSGVEIVSRGRRGGAAPLSFLVVDAAATLCGCALVAAVVPPLRVAAVATAPAATRRTRWRLWDGGALLEGAIDCCLLRLPVIADAAASLGIVLVPPAPPPWLSDPLCVAAAMSDSE